MKTLCKIDVAISEVFRWCVDVKLWQHGDAFPVFGPSVGVDTETELITETMLDPPVVVLGVFDPSVKTCYIVYWRDIPEFMQHLSDLAVEQRYFNVGFDEQVIDNECGDDRPVVRAVEAGNVSDMYVRVGMHDIATIGFKRASVSNLAGCCKTFLKFHLDKGDGTENSARLSFRRYNADGSDYVITEEQAQYLPYDCITTWCLGEVIPKEPTELMHVKGLIVLAHISKNGIPVDMRVYNALVGMLDKAKEDARTELVVHNYPDPAYDAKKEREEILGAFTSAYSDYLSKYGIASTASNNLPGKSAMRLMLLWLYLADAGCVTKDKAASCIAALYGSTKAMSVAERRIYDMLIEQYDLMDVDEAHGQLAYIAYMSKMLRLVADRDMSFADAAEECSAYMDDHPAWVTGEKPIGARKFFNNHVRELLLDNCPDGRAAVLAAVERQRAEFAKAGRELTQSEEIGIIIEHSNLKLATTPKSGEPQLAKQDMWRLKDLGIEDKFLEYQTTYNHANKYKVTYMKRDYIKADGKVHPKFNVLVRTGRTSCTNPNVQNYPSREKQFPLKNMFMAPKGTVLCATDYSFLELCSFAQSCHARFGGGVEIDIDRVSSDKRKDIRKKLAEADGSVLMQVINSGLDPHFWFAGIMKGVITADLSNMNNPEWVAETTKFLSENVSKLERQGAKFANFGQSYAA